MPHIVREASYKFSIFFYSQLEDNANIDNKKTLFNVISPHTDFCVQFIH
jgi:hypothetical protein